MQPIHPAKGTIHTESIPTLPGFYQYGADDVRPHKAY